MALVPRPRHSASPFVVKDSPCLGSGESPNDFSPTAVTARGPGARAITEGLERVDTIATMTTRGTRDWLRFRPGSTSSRAWACSAA